MSLSKCASAALSPVHPPLGTLIDGHSLELVEVLGVGGYGVVYRAIDTDPLSLTGHLKSYAVKCLISPANASSRQRHVHIREIALHQLASVHPGVVTLHRVIEQQNVTYIILDYAPDHDLFTQILRNCRYLGNDSLIRHIFLQLLDAVEYCHLLGIYHRDLKPENVLCFEGGFRVAITDFGLATTEKMSDEFRTGSVYHMSPECQGGDFAPDGYYSPQANDVWSLGIVLLNLATGRNPWKSATATDPTFQAYLREPQLFLPSVLPISYEANELLLRMLDVNWRTRITLPEVRHALKRIDTFYCDGVVFEGSMARCPWEAGMDLDSDEEEIANEVDERAVNEWRRKADVYSVDDSSSSSSSDEDYGETASKDSRAIAGSVAGIPPQSAKSTVVPVVTDLSQWSADSETSSEIVFAARSPTSPAGTHWTDFASAKATWGCESPMSPTSPVCRPTNGHSAEVEFYFDSDISRYPSVEAEDTESDPSVFRYHTKDFTISKKRPGLKLNTHLDALREETSSSDSASMASISSGSSDTMQTAHEYENYSSSAIFFPSNPSALRSSKSLRVPFSMPISTENSTYEDPLSFIRTDDHIAQLLTPAKDTDMASPLRADLWKLESPTPAPISTDGASSPSRYSISSASEFETKWSDPDLSSGFQMGEPPLADGSRASSWNTIFGAASVKTGGIRSPYYTFCRSSAPSPEESAVSTVPQEPVEAFEATGTDALACRATDESQPTFPVDDHAKLTDSGNPCLSSRSPPTEPATHPSPPLALKRIQPRRLLGPESALPAEWQPRDKSPSRAKSARSVALFNPMRFLSRTGSPTLQAPPPPTSDPAAPTETSGSPSPIQQAVPPTQAQEPPCASSIVEAKPAVPPQRVPSLPRRLLSGRNRSPVRAGTTSTLPSRNAGTQLISRIHPRRATIHIGSIFHRQSGESDPTATISPTFTKAIAGTTPISAERSPLSGPEAPNAPSPSTSASPPATPTLPPRMASPAQISTPNASPKSSPVTSSPDAAGQFSPLPVPTMKAGSPPAPARSRRWTVSGWTKGRSGVVAREDPPLPCVADAPQCVHHVPEAADRSLVARKQGNEARALPRPGGNRRRRGWLPSLLGSGFTVSDLQKVVKMPIEAGKWLGSLSSGGNRSKSGHVNGGVV